ncbi:hypothetical protein [Shewanella sp. OMA3-2]|uniref:hypothetical protein n=1 Tax=Shewanella sp. OMA3-2 TaxID=2908650 RepID=UPI001F38F7A4|nr:hypothetical protein [Shewanella sp. OMA3-2]UJF21340.1 hypothetical protein L0B17_14735 [Shewanella sp. OMA3-2]
MNINVTVLGQLLIVWIPISTIIIALLARRKTETPVLMTVIGFITSFIPLISIIIMIVLILKKDIVVTDNKTISTT